MKQIIACLLLLPVLTMHGQPETTAAGMVSRYNMVWTSPGRNAAGSMPCGGGDIGLNVWVENGDLLFYLSQGGMFDEHNQLLKAGRVRLHISSDPFRGSHFRQALRLQEGGVQVNGEETTVTIWVDVFRPVIHASVQSRRPVTVTTSYESWRHEDHIIRGTEFRANSYKVPQKWPVQTYKDSIRFIGNEVLFYHRNRQDVKNIFDYTVEMEGMSAVKDKMYDPLSNNTFGGRLMGYAM